MCTRRSLPIPINMVHLSVEGGDFDRMNRDQLIEILIEARMNAFFVRYVLTGCVLAWSMDGVFLFLYFEAIGESTSSLLECIIRLEHKELHCTIERERWDKDRFENRRSAAYTISMTWERIRFVHECSLLSLSFDARSIELHVKSMIRLREGRRKRRCGCLRSCWELGGMRS